MLRTTLLATLVGFASTATAQDASTPALSATVRASLDGDRTGACLAVALIDGDRVQRAYECADRAAPRAGLDTGAFEIGSVTKTMTAALLAAFIAEGKASLDDPLARHLPARTEVPTFGGKPILLRHLVTHTSGLPALPPGMVPKNPADPYAGLDAKALLDALSKTKLARAPGERFEYSNFAVMLLSHVVARLGGGDFERLLDTRLFTPLGMQAAHVADAPAGVRALQGHTANGSPTAPWTFVADLAGVGGVRATLDDMVRYTRAYLDGSGDARLDASLKATLAQQSSTPPMGMNWMLRPWNGKTMAAHEGGTYGFSSLVAFVPGTRRGVVILSDTALGSTGGLGALGMHLLYPSQPAPKPRRRIAAPAELLEAMEGEYALDGGLRMQLKRRDGALWAQVPGQPAIELAHDDAGDFYPLSLDALLSPQRQPDGRYGFTWSQGGGRVQAQRVDASTTAKVPMPDAATLRGYVGTYPLVPGFALTVTERDGALLVQGTGQPALPVEAAARDVFVVPAVGAEFRFERDAGGRVVAIELRQAGQVLRGARTP